MNLPSLPANLTQAFLQPALLTAWRHVQAKASAPGLDGIDIGDFQADADRQLKRLLHDMLEGSYLPEPVRLFILRKGTKARELGILCVRDRIAHHALAQWLAEQYEPLFIAQSYAFRPGKSARMAAAKVAEHIQGGMMAFVRSDVEEFFPSINHQRLMGKLAATASQQATQLIQRSITLTELRDGMPVQRTRGLCQGSPLSPILSNIYMHGVDQVLVARYPAYVRYCDDFVLLTHTAEEFTQALAVIDETLNQNGLQKKQSKTSLGTVEQGFTFLGFRFSGQGAVAEVRAIEALTQSLLPRLETLRIQLARQSLETRVTGRLAWEPLADVIRGWLQYYTLPADLHCHFETAIALAGLAIVERTTGHWLQLPFERLWAVLPEQALWPLLAHACMDYGQPSMAIRCYEAWFGQFGLNDYDHATAQKLYGLWTHYYNSMEASTLQALVQAYADIGVFSFASALHSQASIAYETAEYADDRPKSEPSQKEISSKSGSSVAAQPPEAVASAIPAPPVEATPDVVERMAELTALLVRHIPLNNLEGIEIERMPNTSRARTGKLPQLLKLPFGRHPQTGSWGVLVDRDGSPLGQPVDALQAFQPTTLHRLHRLLAEARTSPSKPQDEAIPSVHVNELLPLNSEIEAVLKSCAIARNLCAQARATRFLPHVDRLNLLYIFAHMGDMGKHYLHQVMKWTYNYRKWEGCAG